MHNVSHGLNDIASILSNPILNTDSYKASHYLQYPPEASAMFSYIESRGGRYGRTLFFGLQMLIKEYLCRPITPAMIDQAKAFFTAHGEPFNEAGWRYIVEQFGGYLPVRIRAVPEGSVVPTHNVLVTVECDDPRVFWLASYLETMLLRVWYPITVATQSWHVRQTIRGALEQSSDDLTQLPFKLHDFGARGVSSAESAAIGGAAHLVSFMGSDTVLGVVAANHYYNETMAAFSVPAAEHSTITSWGRERETDAFRNMLAQFGKPGAIVSVVSDSYDLFAALDVWGTELKQAVLDSGGMLVDPAGLRRSADYRVANLARARHVVRFDTERQGQARAQQRTRDSGRRRESGIHRGNSCGDGRSRFRGGQHRVRHGWRVVAADQSRHPALRDEVLGDPPRRRMARRAQGSGHGCRQALDERPPHAAAKSPHRRVSNDDAAGRVGRAHG